MVQTGQKNRRNIGTGPQVSQERQLTPEQTENIEKLEEENAELRKENGILKGQLTKAKKKIEKLEGESGDDSSGEEE